MREKAERAGRRRTPFLPGSSALWSEIALVVARQRGIYLAEDVDVFLGREHSLPGECRDTPVLRVRGGLTFHDPARDYESKQHTHVLTPESEYFRVLSATAGHGRSVAEGSNRVAAAEVAP